MTYTVKYTPESKQKLASIRDVRVRRALFERAEALAENPELQGKPLGKELAGCRSVRAVGQRYRIIYEIREEAVLVVVLAVGLRREGDRTDIYEEAKRLIRSGKTEPS